MLVPPWALFILVDIDNEDLNERLTRAHYNDGAVEPSWDLWVAGKAYEEAPKEGENGTVAPVAKDFESQWIGKSVKDCANWLREAPEDVGIDRHYFTVIDAHSKDEDTVLTCRWFICGGVFEVEYYPRSTDEVTMSMWTNWGAAFEDRAMNYQDEMKSEGKPDRSKYVWACTCGRELRCAR